MKKQRPRRFENVIFALLTMPKHKRSCPIHNVSISSLMHIRQGRLVSNCSKFKNLSDFIILSIIQFTPLMINNKPFYNTLFESICFYHRHRVTFVQLTFPTFRAGWGRGKCWPGHFCSILQMVTSWQHKTGTLACYIIPDCIGLFGTNF